MTTVEQMLTEARAGLNRVSPEEAHAAAQAGALLIDIRSDSQRERDGVIPSARFIARNVFEWRCDPASEWRDAELTAVPDRQLIVFCNEGYSQASWRRRSSGTGSQTRPMWLADFKPGGAAGLETRPET